MAINEYFSNIFPGLTESTTQASDFNGNRNSKTFPYPRDGPFMPQLSESHEHQSYSNQYVSIILLNNYIFFIGL